MPFCKKCGDYKFTFPHKCPPAWKTNILDYDGEDNWVDVHATTPELAVIRRAEQYDNGDYDLLDGGNVEILVKNKDGVIEKYMCTGEPIPEYRAKKSLDISC